MSRRAGAAAADQRPHFRRSHRPLRSDINLIRQKHCLIRIVRYEDHSALKFVLYAYKPFVHRRASERVKCTERFINKDYRAFAEWSATAPPFGACRRRALPDRRFRNLPARTGAEACVPHLSPARETCRFRPKCDVLENGALRQPQVALHHVRDASRPAEYVDPVECDTSGIGTQ